MKNPTLMFEASPRMYDALASIRALRDELAEGLPWPSRGALPEGVPTPQARLEALYEAASPEGKKLIDDALICICGWSMDSLRGLA